MEFWRNRRVMVTGACGTVGGELLRQLSLYDVAEVVGIDHNESAVFFADQHFRDDRRFELVLGDVRDLETVSEKMSGVDVVLHTAALKHVILCERSPRDAVQTNIDGVRNVLHAASANNVERVLFTSSDKAVNPTSVMGTSKLMGERLLTAANANRREAVPVFASTRFGNVLGSAGSVIPIFHRQIAAGGPVTLTDPEMTRFIMTLQEAVSLVMESVTLAQGGEVFVTKMPVVRIADLATAMINLLADQYGRRPEDVDVQVIGQKPGEKLYEELVNEEEARRTLELDRYFVVVPALQSERHATTYKYEGQIDAREPRNVGYNSATEVPMSMSELTDYLIDHKLLELESLSSSGAEVESAYAKAIS